MPMRCLLPPLPIPWLVVLLLMLQVVLLWLLSLRPTSLLIQRSNPTKVHVTADNAAAAAAAVTTIGEENENTAVVATVNAAGDDANAMPAATAATPDAATATAHRGGAANVEFLFTQAQFDRRIRAWLSILHAVDH